MVITKFGGTSVGTVEALVRVSAIVKRQRNPPVVVASALGGVTDALLAAAAHASRRQRREADAVVSDLRRRHQTILASLTGPAARDAATSELEAVWARLQALLRRAEAEGGCSPSRQDAIVSTGELASSRVIVDVLRHAGVPAVWVDARRIIVTDAAHTEAAPDLDATRQNARRVIAPLLAARRVPVLGGFIGSTPGGATTTLGRGGSDWSASILGACLEAREIQIWTDVDGVYSGDPRRDGRARFYDTLSFREAERLARAGAKVLHPATTAPAEAAGIPIRVLNTFNPDGSGTLISGDGGGAQRATAGLAWPLVVDFGGRGVTA